MFAPHPSWKRKLAGWSLLLLGAAGLVLPVLNGTIFLLLGIFVLREQHAWSQRALGWAQARWPTQTSRMDALESRMVERCRGCAGWFGRLFRRP